MKTSANIDRYLTVENFEEKKNGGCVKYKIKHFIRYFAFKNCNDEIIKCVWYINTFY